MQIKNVESSGRKPVVMIVDDDEAARLQMRFSLENEGFSVVEAASGAIAVENFYGAGIDLILLDVIMPGLDGFSTCRVLRRLPGGTHTPVVMITALEDAATIAEAFDAGATDFISKPINLLILGHRVRYWLRSGAILQELQVSQKRLFKAQEIARLGHWERDLQCGDFQLTCPAPEQIGLSPPYDYKCLFAAIVAEDKDRVRNLIDEACDRDEAFSVQYRVILPDGNERIILNQGEVIHRDNPPSRYGMGIIQDITELKEAEDKIRHLAFYDNLTGLANRALFREHGLRVLQRTRHSQTRAAIVFIDLDHFKRINDSMGHPSGDKVLIMVAERLKTILRPVDIITRPVDGRTVPLISRVGGDEFTLLVEGIGSTDHLAKLAERIVDSLAMPLSLDGQPILLTASLGLSVYPDDGDDLDTLLRNADTAMYAAKEKGRNTYQFFQNAMNDEAKARFHLGNSLRRALDHNEFVLYYQPQFANQDGYRLTGVEALIRWLDPQKGLVTPDKFLPFAEESGLIHKINEWVLREACTQAQEWVAAGRFDRCRMAINISGNNVNFKQLVEKIIDVLEETGLSPQHLEVELTERVMMENTEEACSTLRRLREMGISIAIDDFGTGYSALSHLQVFPLTTLKIDKSFVQNIDVAGNGLSLLHSIVDIAKSFNLKVIAEGVETEGQKTALRRMNCDELQGYLFSKPVPGRKVEEFLQQGV